VHQTYYYYLVTISHFSGVTKIMWDKKNNHGIKIFSKLKKWRKFHGLTKLYPTKIVHLKGINQCGINPCGILNCEFAPKLQKLIPQNNIKLLIRKS